jgi:hypothetical protein
MFIVYKRQVCKHFVNEILCDRSNHCISTVNLLYVNFVVNYREVVNAITLNTH